MLKKRCLAGIILFLCLVGTGCSKIGKANVIELGTDEESDAEDILAISRHQNYSEGYQDYGYFITTEGNVHFYDFSSYTMNGNSGETDTDYLNKLRVIMAYAVPDFLIEQNLAKQLLNTGNNIDVTETYQTQASGGADMGESIVYFYQAGNDSLVQCSEQGDWDGQLSSKEARAFLDVFDGTAKIIAENCPDSYDAPCYYYTSKDVSFQNIHCGYLGVSGRYVVTNQEELERFIQVTGDDFGLADTFHNPSNRVVCFIQIEQVNTGGYDLKSDGLLVEGRSFRFIGSKDSITPNPMDMVTEVMDGFLYTAVLPVYNFDFDPETDTTPFTEDGWMIP